MTLLPDDAALLIALKARSRDAFAQLFELYADRMFRLAVGMLDDEFEAEDVVQDAFARFLENLDEFEGRSKVGTWLYRVTHNLSVDRLRKRRPEVDMPDLDETLPMPEVFVDWRDVPELSLSHMELGDQLDRAIAGLPDNLKAVFLLREVEGLSTHECADILDISPGNIKVRLHRARLLLREAMTAYFVELGREKRLL